MLYIVWSQKIVIMKNVKQTDKPFHTLTAGWATGRQLPPIISLYLRVQAFLLRNVRVWLRNGTVTCIDPDDIIKNKGLLFKLSKKVSSLVLCAIYGVYQDDYAAGIVWEYEIRYHCGFRNHYSGMITQ